MVIQGYPRSKMKKKVKVQYFLKEGKFYSWANLFKKVSLQGIYGRPRSIEVKNRWKMVKFKSFLKVEKS